MSYNIFKTLILDMSHHPIIAFLYFCGFTCYYANEHFIDTDIWKVKLNAEEEF